MTMCAKPNRDNAIDVYIGDTPEDVIGDDVWAETFTRQPEPLTAEEKKDYLEQGDRRLPWFGRLLPLR